MSDPGTLVGLTPNDALDRAVAYMTRNGASVTGRTENSASFTYRKGPNPLVLIVLLLLFILPGILYWMAASRNVNFSITATRAEGGCRLLFGGEHRFGYLHYKLWIKTLPKPDPTLTVADAESARVEALSIPDEIRRLAKLSEEGIITTEEFEAKKRELLDRM